MTQPRAVFVMAALAVALVGTGTGVAVSRSGGSAKPAPAAGATTAPTTNAEPGIAVSPTTGGTATSPTPATVDPKALLAKAFADALTEGSVHAVGRNASKKLGVAVFDDYDAKIGGIQHISIYGGHVSVRVVGPATYFTGDKRGLTRYMGFTPDEVAALHHQWLRLTAGQPGYQEVTAGVTLASTLHEDRIGAPLRLLRERTVNGVRVVGVRGRMLGGGAPKHATATMWISAGADPLPVEFVAATPRLRLTQTFSDWGKHFRLAEPANIFGQRTSQA
ncbi:MAG: hypothetical protein ACTHK4_06950 [Mycobacteriales bacterium]